MEAFLSTLFLYGKVTSRLSIVDTLLTSLSDSDGHPDVPHRSAHLRILRNTEYP